MPAKTRTVYKAKLQPNFCGRMVSSGEIVLSFDKGNKGTETQLVLDDDEAIKLRDYLVTVYQGKTLCEVLT